MPFDRPVTEHDVAPVVEQEPPAGTEVTAYPVTADPPSDAGAVHVTVAEPSPAIADTDVGAPGTVLGVTAEDAVDGALVPTAFVAVTVNV